MGDTSVSITSGSGTNLHSWSKTVGGSTVHDEFTLPGEFPYPSFVVAPAASVSCTTAGDDMFQVMAGSSLLVRVRRIRVEQAVVITTAAIAAFQFFRLNSAGTGGTAITPAKMNTADSAAGATAASGVPNATHGGASTYLFTRSFWPVQTAPAAGQVIPYFEWVQQPNEEPLIIPAGTSNGIAVRNAFARPGLNVNFEVEFIETSF